MKLKHFITGTCTALLVIAGFNLLTDSDTSGAAEIGYVDLAEFNYNIDSNNSTASDEDVWDTYGNTEKAKAGILATGGEKKSNSRLYASLKLDGEGKSNFKKLKWSDAADDGFYYDDKDKPIAVPILQPKDDSANTENPENEPWEGTPYILFETSTKGYDDIQISMLLGGSNKAPKDFKLQYSLDKLTFTDISNTAVSINKNKKLYDTSFTELPSEICDKDTVYLRLINTSDNAIKDGTLISDDPLSGKLAINNIKIIGKEVGSQAPTNPPATASPQSTALPAGCLAAFTFTRPVPSEGAVADVSLDTTYNVNGAVDGYKAAEGTVASDSYMYVSVDGTNNTSMNWSPDDDIYTINEVNQPAVPIIEASETLAWGTSPYFKFKTSTTGCDFVKLSFNIGGSKKGPKNYKLQYSFDDKSYTDIADAAVVIDDNKKLYPFSFKLPKEISNKEAVYIKLITSDDSPISSKAEKYPGVTGGEAAINNIVFEKISDTDYNATPSPSPTKSPEPTKEPTKAPTENPTESPKETEKPSEKPYATPSLEPQETITPAPTVTPDLDTHTTETPKTQPIIVPITTTTATPASATPASATPKTTNTLKKISTPKLKYYKRGASYVNGTAIKKSTVVLKIKNKTYKIKANAKGIFKIKLKTKLKKGQNLSIYATKTGYKKSNVKIYKVK